LGQSGVNPVGGSLSLLDPPNPHDPRFKVL
jgi:hypothetical protein